MEGSPNPTYIEIETARLCNRTCRWCPNGYTDARRQQELMPWPMFTSLLAELSEHDYRGMIALHNYNEPLLNPRLHDEIRAILQVLPDAQPAIFTNGDYLTSGKAEQLLADGIRYLRVTLYPKTMDKATQDDRQHIERWLALRLGDLDVAWSFGPVRQGFAARATHGACELEVISPAIAATYNDRGGTVSGLPVAPLRRAPCLRTSFSIAVDYTGAFKMCCNVYPETASHEQYVLGNVSVAGLWNLWTSPRMDELRRAHRVADWSLSPMCKTCKHMLPTGASSNRYEQRIELGLASFVKEAPS